MTVATVTNCWLSLANLIASCGSRSLTETRSTSSSEDEHRRRGVRAISRCSAPAAFLPLEITTTKRTKIRRARPGEARGWLENHIANFHTAEDINACVLWPFA